ncbi:MAG TPA: glycine cleavage system aminomethyltransferase GcvT [Acidimicrobiales bacterium]|nr:glycine cleavage system aminomethyltransferase GcvT [Acidimicrobiales bacterium]
MPARHSPLRRCHLSLGARMVDFGGWEMPLAYPSGTLAEHRTCRKGAVAFDVSHLGTVRVAGPGAFEMIQHTLTNNLAKIKPGRAQYSHLLDTADGSVLDDVIVWWVHDEEFHVMPNASNTSRVVDALGGDDITSDRAVVAVQGPHARHWTAEVVPEAVDLPRFGVRPFRWKGAPCTLAGTGYTGEDGFECAVPAPAAVAFWEAVLDAGVMPAGLGARDTLRLEAGLPLHGHELGPGITPLQARLDWVVAWDKGIFPGRAALEEERRRGVSRLLRGLEVEGRRPPRAGYRVLQGGEVVGVVSSGNFSPTLSRGIAFAFVQPHLDVGSEVVVDARGQMLEAKVVPVPFVHGQPASTT